MKKLHFLMLILTITAIMLVGCSSEQNSVSPDLNASDLSLAAVILPANATIISVKLNINAYIGNNQPTNIHQVTSNWDENIVTWNSFGAAFDPSIEASFVSTVGWNIVDITPLFNNWTDGTYDNFGLLLDQVDMNFPRAIYTSKEFYKNRPFLEICYSENGVTTCVQTEVIADTYIWENAPDVNNGTNGRLYTGWHASYDLEKQTLLKFDISLNPSNNDDEDDCDSDDHDGHDSDNDGNYDDHDSDDDGAHDSDSNDHDSDEYDNHDGHDSDHDGDCNDNYDNNNDEDDDHNDKDKDKKYKDKKEHDNDDDDNHGDGDGGR